MSAVSFVILGELASKANSRKIVSFGGRRVSIKSDKDRACVRRGVYLNDRQVREKHVFHGVDRNNPRVEIEIDSIES